MTRRSDVYVDLGKVDGDETVEFFVEKQPDGTIVVKDIHRWKRELELEANKPPKLLPSGEKARE